ncbi:MAG: SHOCT domain-containing protein [Solirubrobacteraceae bacterium]
MFGGHKKLYTEGAQADGQVIYFGWESSACWNYHLTVRVKLPDGSSTEFKTGNINKDNYGTLFEGAVVPVRYDPSDHSKVALDLPALKARQAQSKAAEQGALDAQFANLGTPGAPGVGAGQAIAGLGELGALKAQVLAAAAQNPGSVIDLRLPSPDGSAPDPVERLTKLTALKQQGLLSDAEFEAAKAKVLGES